MTDAPRQLSLPIEADYLAAGIPAGEIPAGLGNLSAREMKFVARLLAHGQLAQAAIEAGYSANSAGAIASETLRKPKVQAFYRQCLAKSGANAETVISRVVERSVLLHDKARAAAQSRAETEEALRLLLEKEEVTSGKNACSKQAREYETELTRQLRLEKHYITLANQTDTLLAQLIGKLTVNIEGNVNHWHDGEIAVTGAGLDYLAHLRRDRDRAFAGGGPN